MRKARVIPGVPPTFCKTFANSEGIYYTAHVEKKSRSCALPLRNSKNAESRLETRSLGHCGRWRRTKLLARYASGRVVCFPVHPLIFLIRSLFSSVPTTLLDIQGDHGRIINDRLHNGAHPLYKTFAETVVDAHDDSGTAKHAEFEDKEARPARRQMRLAKAGQRAPHQRACRFLPRVRRYVLSHDPTSLFFLMA